MDKLTDSEIVKDLEEWRKELVADYQRLQLLDAPMDCFEESHGDTITNLTNALDLINRLQAEKDTMQHYIDYLKAENERLKKSNEMFTDIGKMYSEIKAEAYKEFAERLKKAKQYSIERHENIVPVAVIDWILKELVGEDNA